MYSRRSKGRIAGLCNSCWNAEDGQQGKQDREVIYGQLLCVVRDGPHTAARSRRDDRELHIVIVPEASASVHHRRWNRSEMGESMNVVRILAPKRPGNRLTMRNHYSCLLKWEHHHSMTQEKLCEV